MGMATEPAELIKQLAIKLQFNMNQQRKAFQKHQRTKTRQTKGFVAGVH